MSLSPPSLVLQYGWEILADIVTIEMACVAGEAVFVSTPWLSGGFQPKAVFMLKKELP